MHLRIVCTCYATDAMLQNHLLQFISAITRGGWDFVKDSVFFQYPTQKLNTIAAGKVLAKWANPNMKVTAPTLDAVPSTEGQQDKVREFACELFSACSVSVLLQGKLIAFRNVMVATLIMYYDDVAFWKHGPMLGLPDDNLLMTELHTACIRCNIAISRLPEWCKCIKDRFQLDNARNFAAAPGEDATEKTVAILQNIAQKYMEKADRLEADVAELKGDMKMAVGMLRQLCATGASPTATPPRPQKLSRSLFSSDIAGARASSNEQECPPPTAAAASTASTSTVGAGANLQMLQHVHVPANFSKMSDWTCQRFVSEVVKGGVNVEAKGWYNNTVNKKLAAKGKLIYLKLESMASDDEKQYFVSRRCPKITGKERTDWLNKIGTIVPRLENAMITELLNRHFVATDKEVTDAAIESARGRQSTGVSALGGLIERVMTAENKKRQT